MDKKFTKVSLVVEFLKGNLHYFVISIVAALLVTGLDMISPQLIRTTVDSVIGTKEMEMPAFVMEMIASIGGVSYLRENIWIIGVLIVKHLLKELLEDENVKLESLLLEPIYIPKTMKLHSIF